MKIEAFKKSYNGNTVLDFPGVELEAGKIYAVIGANGSGKSTFARVVSGIEKPDSGKKVCSRCSIGFMPQKSYGFRMSLKKNLLLNKKDEQKAGALIEQMKLSPLSGRRANRLSGGETARMALIRLMMRDYELLILDEPSASMDMESTLLSEKLILDYREKTGCALLLITHSLSQAKRLADETLYFEKGKFIASGPTSAFLSFYGE